MSEQIKDGGPAFPVQDAATWQGHGMALRDYFAAKAMQGDWAQGNAGGDFHEDAARYYQMADAMLAAREAKS